MAGRARKHGGDDGVKVKRSGSDKAPPKKSSGSSSNAEVIEQLMHGRTDEGQDKFGTILRGADVLAESGVLDEFKKLEGIEVPKSERNRTLSDDAVLVMQGLAKLDPEQIDTMKKERYDKLDQDTVLDDALEVGHYGSESHKEYGAIVERLTGGVISAEEAMALNPSGGLIGPDVSILRHLDGIASLHRHAMRHDAVGFLKTHFGVGPGYGSKTTIFGFQSDNPLAGQILGWSREVDDDDQSNLDFDDTSSKATSSRYNESEKVQALRRKRG